LACGSGACAAAVASAVLDRTGRDIRVLVPGGALRTVWADDDHVWLTGPAEEVFAGEIGSDWLRARGIDAPTLAEAS
jgi:diaminopimelate epimerase